MQACLYQEAGHGSHVWGADLAGSRDFRQQGLVLGSYICPCNTHEGVQDIEAALLKADKAKDERRAAQDQPAAVAQALALNDASAARRRGRMMLPAPQVPPLPPLPLTPLAWRLLCA